MKHAAGDPGLERAIATLAKCPFNDSAQLVRFVFARARALPVGAPTLEDDAALEHILRTCQARFDALSRVTDLANAAALKPGLPFHPVSAREIRTALGDGYVGGPVL